MEEARGSQAELPLPHPALPVPQPLSQTDANSLNVYRVPQQWNNVSRPRCLTVPLTLERSITKVEETPALVCLTSPEACPSVLIG